VRGTSQQKAHYESALPLEKEKIKKKTTKSSQKKPQKKKKKKRKKKKRHLKQPKHNSSTVVAITFRKLYIFVLIGSFSLASNF